MIDVLMWGVMGVFIFVLVVGFNRQMMERHAKRDEAIKRKNASLSGDADNKKEMK